MVTILAFTSPVLAYNNTRFSFKLVGIQNEVPISQKVRKTYPDAAVIAVNSDPHWIQGKELLAFFIMPARAQLILRWQPTFYIRGVLEASPFNMQHLSELLGGMRHFGGQ